MATKITKTRLVLRNDNSTKWSSKNPILLKGEVGLEEDTRKFKIGDGVSNWNSLPYANITDLSNYYTKSAIDEIVKNLATTEYVDNKVATEIEKLTQGKEVVTLDESGKIPAAQLPGFVDDVIEGYISSDLKTFYDSLDELNRVIIPAESSKLYIDLTTNKTYRWSGTQYTEISSNLALGETSSTAYAGNKGKQNADDIAALQNIVPTLQTKTDDTLNTTSKTVVGAINELKQNQTLHDTNIQKNTNDITKIKQDITAANTAISSNFNRITDLEGEVDESFIQIKEINNKFESGELSDFIDVEELPELIVPTEVPASGYIAKVYINTSLTNEEVLEIVKSIELVNVPDIGLAYMVTASADMTNGVGFLGYVDVGLYYFSITINGETTVIWCSDKGWENKFTQIAVGYENALSLLLSQLGGTNQNNKLKNLISATPFDLNTEIELSKIYKVSNHSQGDGTTVPNTGYIDKVYFNTSLSVDEVESLLNNLIYDKTSESSAQSINIFLWTDMGHVISALKQDNGGRGIATIHPDYPDTQYVWANQKFVDNKDIGHTLTKAGWQNFTNPIEMNSNVVASENILVPVGFQNTLIKDLFSTTPFKNKISGCKYYRVIDNQWEEVLGKNNIVDVEELPLLNYSVPTSGYIEKIYFNRNLSTEQMVEIFDKAIPAELKTSRTYVYMNPYSPDHYSSFFIWSDDNGWQIGAEIDQLSSLEKIWSQKDGWVVDIAELDINQSNYFSSLAAQEPGVLIVNDQLSEVFAIRPFGTKPEYELDKIYRVPEYKLTGGTEVPSSGTIEKVYINTNLSDEEMHNIAFSVDVITVSGVGTIYPIVGDGSMANGVVIWAYGLSNGVYTKRSFLHVVNGEESNMLWNSDDGWVTPLSEIELGYTTGVSTLASQLGFEVQNDRLTKLISPTPFTRTGAFIGYNYYRLINSEWIEVLGEPGGPGGPEGTKKIITLPPIIDVNTYDYTFSDEDINLLKEDKAILQIQTLVNGEVVEGFYNVLNLSSVMGSGGFYVGVSYELLNYYLNLIFVNYETKEMPIVNRTPLYSKLSISLSERHTLNLNDLYSTINSVDLLPLVDYWYSNNTNSIKTATENSLKSKKRTITPSPLPPWNAIYDPDPQLAESPFMIPLTTDELNNITAISGVFTVLLEDDTNVGEFVANSLALFDDNGKPYFKFMLCSNVGEGKEWSFEFNFIDNPTTTEQGYLTTQNISDVYNSKTKELIGTIGKITFKKINVFFNY